MATLPAMGNWGTTGNFSDRDIEVTYMQTQEISRDEWRTFFDSFSRQYEGWLATLELLGDEIGAQQQGRELALAGVSLASGGEEPEAISIGLGITPDERVSHAITQPTRVWLEKTDQGAIAALQIESADGTKALLRFRSPLPAEFVDGVVLDQ
jgi:hypothetical protein